MSAVSALNAAKCARRLCLIPLGQSSIAIDSATSKQPPASACARGAPPMLPDFPRLVPRAVDRLFNPPRRDEDLEADLEDREKAVSALLLQIEQGRPEYSVMGLLHERDDRTTPSLAQGGLAMIDDEDEDEEEEEEIDEEEAEMDDQLVEWYHDDDDDPWDSGGEGEFEQM